MKFSSGNLQPPADFPQILAIIGQDSSTMYSTFQFACLLGITFCHWPEAVVGTVTEESNDYLAMYSLLGSREK
jgi:hypothetical protein